MGNNFTIGLAVLYGLCHLVGLVTSSGGEASLYASAVSVEALAVGSQSVEIIADFEGRDARGAPVGVRASGIARPGATLQWVAPGANVASESKYVVASVDDGIALRSLVGNVYPTQRIRFRDPLNVAVPSGATWLTSEWVDTQGMKTIQIVQDESFLSSIPFFGRVYDGAAGLVGFGSKIWTTALKIASIDYGVLHGEGDMYTIIRFVMTGFTLGTGMVVGMTVLRLWRGVS